MIVNKVVSGGQTGVDIAAIDTAIELSMDWGGLIPRGRRQEMGQTVPISYDRFTEHVSPEWLPRTYANVDAAGATLILPDTWPPDGGTGRTYRYAREVKGRELVCACAPSWHGASTARDRVENIKVTRAWLLDCMARLDGPFVLNVAGPRASKWPDGYAATRRFLREVLR